MAFWAMSPSAFFCSQDTMRSKVKINQRGNQMNPAPVCIGPNLGAVVFAWRQSTIAPETAPGTGASATCGKSGSSLSPTSAGSLLATSTTRTTWFPHMGKTWARRSALAAALHHCRRGVKLADSMRHRAPLGVSTCASPPVPLARAIAVPPSPSSPCRSGPTPRLASQFGRRTWISAVRCPGSPDVAHGHPHVTRSC